VSVHAEVPQEGAIGRNRRHLDTEGKFGSRRRNRLRIVGAGDRRFTSVHAQHYARADSKGGVLPLFKAAKPTGGRHEQYSGDIHLGD
jgi:hypothetical protein